MGLPEDLLQQAWHLAKLDLRKPKQANLRRSISTAYYALFHRLVADAAWTFSRTKPDSLMPRIARTMAHAEMNKVCKSVSEGSLAPVLRELQPSGFSVAVKNVAKEFVKLQGQRHQADYDLAAHYTRTEVLEILAQAEFALDEWRKVHGSDEANVFLAALLFANRWSK